jgi:uncharacterized repeat protein (TIGR03803 family)
MLKITFILLILLTVSNKLLAQPELWATTNNGGAILGGTIFKLDTAGNNYSLIYDWDELNNGKKPHCGLLQASNEKLYGVTFQDGSMFGGVLYQYDYVTNTYTKKHDFIDATGSFPEGQVIQASNGKLYGLAGFGGAFNLGVLYEYDLTTDVYTNLVDFDGPIYGGGPHGKLIQAPNGNLYGVNSHGGAGGYGTLFEYNITTSTMLTKINLDSINSGYHPYGGLTLASNGKMYGLSNFGGILNKGLLYEYDYLTNTITKQVDFLGPNGAFPYNDLFQASDGKLYGLTYEGGTFGKGTLFEFDIITGLLTVKINFDGGINGSNPKGVLMESSNGKLYGFNSFGGAFNKGVVFEYNITTEVIVTKLDFDGVNGVYNSQNYFIEICAKPTISISTVPSDTICYNQTLTLTASGTGLSYIWDNSVTNGIAFDPTLGNTSYTVSSTNVCGTSSNSINIYVKPSYTAHIYDSICTGNSYTFPDGSNQANITNSLVDTSLFSAITSCDSNVIMHLFVKPKYYINTIISICSEESYTFPDGFTENFITSNLSHTSNLQTTLSCDSIITTSIEVLPIYNIKDSVYVCPGDPYTFPDGFIENNILSQVIHTSSLTTIANCDSIIITTVNVNLVYTLSESIQICSGEDYVFPDGFLVNNITVPIIHVSSIFTNMGCDSIVTTALVVNPSFMVVENINLCEGSDYTFPDGTLSSSITNNMSHISILNSPSTCDTSVTTNIIIAPHFSNIVYDTICFGEAYIFPDGFTINNTSNNTNHLSNLQSIYGCDSTITTSINVRSIDTSVVLIGNNQLIANTTTANYQWFDCLTNSTVGGAVFQTFIPSTSSDYAVIVSDNYCIDTSFCYPIINIGIGIDEISDNTNYLLFPNPTSGFTTLKFNEEIFDGKIYIYSINGQLLKFYKNVNGSQIEIDLSLLEKGNYLIKIETKYVIKFTRVTKT